MNVLALLLLLPACGNEEPPKKVAEKPAKKVYAPDSTPIMAPEAPASPRPVQLERSSGSVAWRLLDHLDEGTYNFAAGSGATAIDGTFALGADWKNEGRRKGGWSAWSTALPFETNMPRPNYSPMGARLYVNGKEVAFRTSIAAPSAEPTPSWYVDQGRIILLAPGAPGEWSPGPELVVEELATQLKQRSLSTSGLTPARFASTSHTYERQHRPGLFLPGGSTAEFNASLPAKGKLRFGMGLLDDPLTGAIRGDGVDVRVTLDGVELWKGRAEPKRGHNDVVVPLPDGVARTGKLRFESLSGPTTEGDDLVLTAPYVANGEAAAPRRVLVVGIDTLRWDALSANGYEKETSTELDQWLAQSVQFTNAWTPAPRTKPSFRTAFTGRFPDRAGGAPNVAEVLGPLGFTTGGVVANVHLVPRFNFNDGMDFWEYENGAKGTVQVDRALDYLKAHQDEDTFMFVHIMDPHTFYNAPEHWKKQFVGDLARPEGLRQQFNRWQIYDLMKKRRLDDDAKTWIRAQYDAEVAYTSHEVSRLLSEVEKLRGDTLTIIHTDHGEEFWDHGAFEHNHSLYSELVHAQLAVRPPGGWKGAPKITENVGLVDIAATIFDYVGVPAERRPPTDGVSLRPLIDPGSPQAESLRATLFARPLPLGHMRYNKDRWGVVYQKYKYILHTASGNQELYDLQADPGEENNLSKKADAASLMQMRQALAQATGWPVMPGFRIRVGPTPTETTFTFKAPVAAVSVMEPDLREEIRANLEWGETPKTLRSDIGTVQLAADRKSFTFTPGPRPLGGTIFLQCEAEPCPAGTLTMGSVTTPVVAATSAGGTLYAIQPGWILVPSDNQDDAATAAPMSSTEAAQLESLGYLHTEGD